jgi:hypothetical protein
VPFSCQDSGLMWPDVARRLPALAPNLAPSKLISSTNGPIDRTKGQPDGQLALRHRGPRRRSRGRRSAITRRAGFPGAARPEPSIPAAPLLRGHVARRYANGGRPAI